MINAFASFFVNQRTNLLDLRSSEIDLRSSRMNQRTNLVNQRTNFLSLCFSKIQRRYINSILL
jgi:hypothetical protein